MVLYKYRVSLKLYPLVGLRTVTKWILNDVILKHFVKACTDTNVCS